MANYVGDGSGNLYSGTEFADDIDGQGGNDTLDGNGGDDLIQGGAGHDILRGMAGKDTLLGGLHDDILVDILDGERDMLDAGDGDDIVQGAYKDTLIGGSGTDSLGLYLNSLASVNIDLTGLTGGGSVTFGQTFISGFEAGFVTGTGGADKMTAAGFSMYLTSLGGADTLNGAAGDDGLTAGYDVTGDADVMRGAGGNDTMQGGIGDRLDGGHGEDEFELLMYQATVDFVVDFTAVAAGGTVNLGHGTLVSGCERGSVIFGSGDDHIKVGESDVKVQSWDGADTLIGGGGGDDLDGFASVAGDADVVRGGEGNDTLAGGLGDRLDGGDDTDEFRLAVWAVTGDFVVNFAPVATGGTVNLGAGTIVTGCERGTAFFGSGDDQIKVGEADVTVWGGAGADTLIGGDGDDDLRAGEGDDVIKGGLGVDVTDYFDIFGSVVVDLNIIGFQQTGAGGMDSLSGIEDVRGSQFLDRLTGDGAANRLSGATGADTLLGGAGDDTLTGGGVDDQASYDTDRLIGGAGRDVYTGGAGDDVMVWASILHSTVAAPDRVTDLEAGDTINLKDIDADTTTGGDQAFTVVGALTGVAGQLALVFDGTKTQFRMDTNGDGAADGLIEATGDHTGHADFVL